MDPAARRLEEIVDHADKLSDNYQDYGAYYFIMAYCSPGIEADIGEGMYSLLLYSYPEDAISRRIIRSHLRSLSYNNFLRTIYWKSIAKYVKFKAGNRCILDDNMHRLNVHHRHYLRLGNEILHLEDLVCLCESCHNAFHEKLIKRS